MSDDNRFARPPAPAAPDRNTPPKRPLSFFDFFRRHPRFLATIVVLMAVLLALDGWLIHQRAIYRHEIQQLRAGMDSFERQRSDAILSSREKRVQMMMQLIRLQARWGKDIHLSISVDSGRMYLERQGALLREIPIQAAPQRRIGKTPDTVQLAVPRGARTVQAVFGPDSVWEVPKWVYFDRRLKVPASAEQRIIKQALGPVAIVLDGGTVIYSLPAAGPLNDSSYTLPGSVRARAQDLQAIVENVTKGMIVYFY